MAKLIQPPNSQPVNSSEAQTVHFLVEQLPNTYTVIPNAEISQKGQPPFEYDAIIIAPHAVYVVEIKRWLGGIRGDDFTWVIAGIHHRPNPLITTNKKAKVLKSVFDRYAPEVGRFWVDAVILIDDQEGELDLHGACRKRVFRDSEILTFLTDPITIGEKAKDLRPVRGFLESAIQKAVQGRQTKPLQYGSYLVVETLSRRELISEFLARNLLLPDSSYVRLRVFSYNPYQPPEQLEKHKAKLRREAEALQKIGYHPNLIMLRSFEASPEDPNLFIEVTDWSEGGTLRTILNRSTPLSLERKLELASGITAGLQAVHKAGVIHRDLRPENILIGKVGLPRLMNLEHSRLENNDGQTVGFQQPEEGISQAYLAPEIYLNIPKVTISADLYSLGMIIFEMLVGEVLYDDPQKAIDSSDSCTNLLDYISDVPPDLNNLVCDLLQIDPSKRPQSSGEVWERLKKIMEKPSGTLLPLEIELPELTNQVEVEDDEPAIYKVDQLIDGKYQVQKKLSEGGFGQVYKVYDEIFDQVFALKIFNNTNQLHSSLQQEASALIKLDHPNIVKVKNWGRLSQSGRFYLVSEFVEGEELTRFTQPENRLSIREAVIIIIDLLNALEYIHPKIDRINELKEKSHQEELSNEEYEELISLQNEGWLHRDIKPNNLMLSSSGVKLIDFNIAKRTTEVRNTVTGTPGYMLPSVGTMRWGTEGDLFATGVVLYELVTGHHPYPEQQPGYLEATDPRIYVPALNPIFAELLLRAVSCSDEVHYHSARLFRFDLLDLVEDYLVAATPSVKKFDIKLEPEEIGLENYNPYVTRLLKLYSQAKNDNSGTRGLDDIARLTYVHTKLDQVLQPTILEGKYKLVIITGNAGDGKTAFIQSLENYVKDQGELIDHPSSNSSRFKYRGHEYFTNYDGSQDEGKDRVNDIVLQEFFSSFDDTNIENLGKETPIHIIAINEGRLVDFFSDIWTAQEQNNTSLKDFRKLGKFVGLYFENYGHEVELPDWLVIIDLNQRSVIASDSDQENSSIFDRQLQSFLKPEFWLACQNCSLKTKCFIKYNVDTFSDPVSGPAVRSRLRTLLEIIHLRRQLHITMRDLRSALSWLLFRDQSCQDVAMNLTMNNTAQSLLSWFYYNAFDSDEIFDLANQGEDRLVSLIRQIDPAKVSNPETDRMLFYKGLEALPILTFEGRSTNIQDIFNSWELPNTKQTSQTNENLQEHLQHHAYLRRIAFFERRDRGWEKMLPYKYLDSFKEATKGLEKDLEFKKKKVASGFSFVEGARNPQITEHFICIRAGQNVKAKIHSFRLFPLSDFTIEIPLFQADRFLEYSNHHFSFFHNPKEKDQIISGTQRATLTVSLDLLELLEEINGGYIPSPDDISGIYINLITFKNALSHIPYKRVLLTRDDKQYYELIQIEQSKLKIQVWQPNRMDLDET